VVGSCNETSVSVKYREIVEWLSDWRLLPTVLVFHSSFSVLNHTVKSLSPGEFCVLFVCFLLDCEPQPPVPNTVSVLHVN
jgi:hypothetical protein